jgi:hypothetical protein
LRLRYELADHRRFTLATDVDVYFCDPRSPWQRGANENTNRLLRQYLHKVTDLALHSQAKLSALARQLNDRPRKTLVYQTPAEYSPSVLQRSVEPTTNSSRQNEPARAATKIGRASQTETRPFLGRSTTRLTRPRRNPGQY